MNHISFRNLKRYKYQISAHAHETASSLPERDCRYHFAPDVQGRLYELVVGMVCLLECKVIR